MFWTENTTGYDLKIFNPTINFFDLAQLKKEVVIEIKYSSFKITSLFLNLVTS